jgi:hypothetical protein
MDSQCGADGVCTDGACCTKASCGIYCGSQPDGCGGTMSCGCGSDATCLPDPLLMGSPTVCQPTCDPAATCLDNDQTGECVLLQSGGHVCVLELGDACNGGCEPGLICASVTDGMDPLMVCASYCTTVADCPSGVCTDNLCLPQGLAPSRMP